MFDLLSEEETHTCFCWLLMRFHQNAEITVVLRERERERGRAMHHSSLTKIRCAWIRRLWALYKYCNITIQRPVHQHTHTHTHTHYWQVCSHSQWLLNHVNLREIWTSKPLGWSRMTVITSVCLGSNLLPCSAVRWKGKVSFRNSAQPPQSHRELLWNSLRLLYWETKFVYWLKC